MAQKEIWIYAEFINNQLASVYQELLTKAKQLKKTIPDSIISTVVLGYNNAEKISALQELGTEKIYQVDNENLSIYRQDVYAKVVSELISLYSPEMFFIGATAIGSELAPTVAIKNRTGLAAHCVDICHDTEKNRINCLVPAFGGKVVSEIYISKHRPIMASVRPGILEKQDFEPISNVEIINSQASYQSLTSQEVLLEVVEQTQTEKSLTEADIALVAGRGVANKSSFDLLEKLSHKLGVGLGYTRSFTDSGFVSDETHVIGTSGVSIKPQLFIGFGISGAIHFVSGMEKSKVVYNINNDNKAKIFNVSDYGAVGDANKVIELLSKKYF
ncbi:electron transfer flavoprotein subunit alpha/FixB family protein [Streptococcus moroccensis]|uniref:Electron transfer flavoprotein alpha subunit n=1 Tax=Streptococcus moroccensis TaxID=1451356 RepID=A0ABT9YTD5_9STRE|nr:electron transfer flavoprotein subunit alpha/FixB family protein [Streptococcus moroccensis]MDQ0223261.1 electron transfer flavoprotein alpha subunit [Streptococcus moroccensis]